MKALISNRPLITLNFEITVNRETATQFRLTTNMNDFFHRRALLGLFVCRDMMLLWQKLHLYSKIAPEFLNIYPWGLSANRFFNNHKKCTIRYSPFQKFSNWKLTPFVWDRMTCAIPVFLYLIKISVGFAAQQCLRALQRESSNCGNFVWKREVNESLGVLAVGCSYCRHSGVVAEQGEV